MATQIHETASISEYAELGAEVVIGQGAIVEGRCVIGDHTRIDPYAIVKANTSIGRECHLHSHCVVGNVPQDLKFQGEETETVIGDSVIIREFVTIHRGTAGGGGITSIGSGCLLMAYVHIAHDCRIGDGNIFSNAANLAGHVETGDYVTIAGMSGVHQFVRIGDHAFLGGMSGLAQDLPPYMLAAGARATLRGPNMIGLKRHDFSMKTVQALKSAYKFIWRSEIPRQEALTMVEEEFGGDADIHNLLTFIRESTRGVVRAADNDDE